MNNNLFGGPANTVTAAQTGVEQGKQNGVQALPHDMGQPFGELADAIRLRQSLESKGRQSKQQEKIVVPTPEQPAAAGTDISRVPRMPPQMDMNIQDLMAGQAAAYINAVQNPEVRPQQPQAQKPSSGGDITLGLMASMQSQMDTLANGNIGPAGSTLNTPKQHFDAIIGSNVIDSKTLNTSFKDQASALVFGNNSEKARNEQSERAQEVLRAISQFRTTERKINQTHDWSANRELQTRPMVETRQFLQDEQIERMVAPSRGLNAIMQKLNPSELLRMLRGLETPVHQAAETFKQRQQKKEPVVAQGKSVRGYSDRKDRSEKRAGSGTGNVG